MIPPSSDSPPPFSYQDWTSEYIQVNEENPESINLLSEEEICTIIYQLAASLDYLHSQNVIFRNLKPENIVFTRIEDLSSLKICNFEFAVNATSELVPEPEDKDTYYFDNYIRLRRIERKLKGLDKEKRKSVGTYIYMAPEMISEQEYNQNIDVWALGVIFYLLLTNNHPLQYLSDFISKKEMREAILDTLKSENPENLIDFDIEELQDINPEILNLLKKMLAIDPKERITASELTHSDNILSKYFKDYLSKVKSTWVEASPSSGFGTPSKMLTLFCFEEVMSKTTLKQASELRKIIIESFSDKIINKQETDELSTLFNSLELTEDASIDQENIDMFYSVYAEGCSMENEEDDERLDQYKKLLLTKEQYNEKEFIHNVVVFKNLIYPTTQLWNNIYNELDKNNRGFFTLGELQIYVENCKKDLSKFKIFQNDKVLDIEVDYDQFSDFLMGKTV